MLCSQVASSSVACCQCLGSCPFGEVMERGKAGSQPNPGEWFDCGKAAAALTLCRLLWLCKVRSNCTKRAEPASQHFVCGPPFLQGASSTAKLVLEWIAFIPVLNCCTLPCFLGCVGQIPEHHRQVALGKLPSEKRTPQEALR